MSEWYANEKPKGPYRPPASEELQPDVSFNDDLGALGCRRTNRARVSVLAALLLRGCACRCSPRLTLRLLHLQRTVIYYRGIYPP